MTPEGTRFWLSLTKRQRRVMTEMCETADTYALIAERLGMTEDAVKQRAAEMYRRAGIDNRMGLAMWAWRHAILPCPCGRSLPEDDGEPGGCGYGGA